MRGSVPERARQSRRAINESRGGCSAPTLFTGLFRGSKGPTVPKHRTSKIEQDKIVREFGSSERNRRGRGRLGMGSSNGASDTGNGRKNLWSGPLLLAVTAAVVLLVLTITIGTPLLTSYDKAHLQSMECTVNKAWATAGRFASNGVEIETSECGQLTFRTGVTRANSDEIAAQIKVGGRFIFEIGAATRSLTGFFHAIGSPPEVYSFKKL